MYRSGKIELKEILTQANIDFFKNFKDFKQKIDADDLRAQNTMMQLQNKMNNIQKRILEIKKATDEFIKKVEAWDGKEHVEVEKHPFGSTKRYFIQNDLTVKDKQQIIQHIVAETKGMAYLNGIEIALAQISLAFLNYRSRVVSEIETDLINLFEAIETVLELREMNRQK